MTAQVGERERPAPGWRARVRLGSRLRWLATAPAWSQTVTAAAALVAVYSLWLLGRPFTGLEHDARVYIGRAMADLAPSGIARDLMFAEVGQASFSLYTGLARAVVQALGPVQAAALLGIAGASVWFAAMALLLQRLAGWRLGLLMLAFVIALPSTYGGLGVFQFGEIIAAPRALAEAGVLAALAALVDRRHLLALALLALAAAFHPIMALGGAGVVLLVLMQEDRRWLWPTLAVGAAAVIAARLGAPVLNRLFEPVDAEWLVPLHLRNPYLFTRLWTPASWAAIAVQGAALYTAAELLGGRAKRILLAAGMVGALGVAAAVLFGDLLDSLLVLQLQPWRALWLVAALGSAGLAVCSAKLWDGGDRDRVGLALLAGSWLALDVPPLAAAAALAALLLRSPVANRFASRLGSRTVWIAWALVGVFAAGWYAYEISRLVPVLAVKPADMKIGFAPIRNLRLHVLPLALTGWALYRARGQAVRRVLPVALSAAALCLSTGAWSSWGPVVTRALKGGGHPSRSLIARLAARPGEVLWIGGDTEAWRLAARPAWANDVQGASIVFSRKQALTWRARAERLVQLGLGRRSLIDPWLNKPEPVLTPRAEALAALCRQRDAPAWVISPVPDGDAPPDLPGVTVWRGGFSQYRIEERHGRYTWRRVTGFAVIPCRGAQDAAGEPERNGAAA